MLTILDVADGSKYFLKSAGLKMSHVAGKEFLSNNLDLHKVLRR